MLGLAAVAEVEGVRTESWQALTLPTFFAAVGLGLLVYDHFDRINGVAARARRGDDRGRASATACSRSGSGSRLLPRAAKRRSPIR